jgi:hypothetical protein
MDWILNDLSLDNQFIDIDDFVEKMSTFLRVKSGNNVLDKRLLCSRDIGNVEIVKGLTSSHVVMKRVPHDIKSQILSWTSKNGPFWSDERSDNPDDYFEHESIDVTDQGLGECSRRAYNDKCVNSYSFEGKYSKTPLIVQHGLKEEPLGLYDICNIWGISDLQASANEAVPKPTCWIDAIDRLKDMFPCLVLSGLVYDQMSSVPYSDGNFEGMCERFRVLTEYLNSRDSEGSHTAKTEEILKNHFQGDKAWFSDESDQNIIDFDKALTFKDLFDEKNKLFPFHGKIKTPQLRIHIEWPIPPIRKKVQVVYIGPKLTKR